MTGSEARRANQTRIKQSTSAYLRGKKTGAWNSKMETPF